MNQNTGVHLLQGILHNRKKERKKALLCFVKAQVCLERIVLSEICEARKDK